MSLNKQQAKGFTLIELLVVVAIISLLSSVIMTSLSETRAKARDAKRREDMLQVRTALEMYYNDHGAYPSTSFGYRGTSVNGGGRPTSGPNAYIPGLTPKYIAVLPTDPSGTTTGWSGYLYVSDGKSYKFMLVATGPESFPEAGQIFYDPLRPTYAWMICSGEPACSSW